jgi:two-component system repressor protein LuxO
LPQLTSRGDDIVLLILNLVGKMISGNKLKVKSISWGLINQLKSMELRGNIRELENVLTRILFNTTGSVINEKVFSSLNLQDTKVANGDPQSAIPNQVQPLWEVEKDMIEKALGIFPHNLSKVATELEISRSSLYRYGINE